MDLSNSISKGDIVMIKDVGSVNKSFLGNFAVVTETNGTKVELLFRQMPGGGSLSHTAHKKDLQKVGELTPPPYTWYLYELRNFLKEQGVKGYTTMDRNKLVEAANNEFKGLIL